MGRLELTEELLAEVAAALRQAGRGGTLSHELAAAAWGLDLVEEPVRRLTVPRNRSRRRVAGWQVRRADLTADDVVRLGDVRVTSALRTVQDLCRVLPFGPALAAVDSALRSGLVPVEQLGLADARGRGSARLRAVACCADPVAGSALESLLRSVLHLAGLPPPLTQHVIRNAHGELVARVDFCWPDHRLVVEADGFAFHSDRASYRSDRRRLNELERLGWRVLRFSWEDVVEHPDAVAALVRSACSRVAERLCADDRPFGVHLAHRGRGRSRRHAARWPAVGPFVCRHRPFRHTSLAVPPARSPLGSPTWR